MSVQVFCERAPWENSVQGEVWERIARKALEDHGMDLDLVDLTVSLVGRETMREYHRRFRGEDKDTDVMAFPAHTHDPETQHFYLGDILICFPVAEGQARQAGHGVSEELCLLFTHGLLHLLGYDDETPESRARMWDAQSALLEWAGCRLRTQP